MLPKLNVFDYYVALRKHCGLETTASNISLRNLQTFRG